MTFTSLPPAVQSLIMGGAVLGALVGILAYVTLLERKFAARLQSRIGPYRVGPRGLLQPIADGVKLMLKEDVTPTTADRPIFNLAPVVFLIPCLLIFATIPFAPGIGVADLDTGVLFFLAISSRQGVKSLAQVKVPKGEAYARVEGARGEVGCYLVADGTNKPYRMKWRGASFSNLAVLPHIIPGVTVADVVAIMGSVDPVFGEVDR